MSGRLTDEQRRWRELSEQEFRDQVTDAAAIYGWDWMFVKPLRAAGGIWKTPTYGPLGKGWPDTQFIRRRDGRQLFVEFKRELGKLEPDQERVIAILRAAGMTVYVWRPSDLQSAIEVLA